MVVRLKDIAHDLSLSVVTVSKVLRNHPDISAETRKRVLKRIKELNYQPNFAARALITGMTWTIGLVVPDLLHPFFAQITQEISGEVRKKGYSLFLSSSALPLYRQRAILIRDLGIDVALTTINDAVLRVGELLIPVVGTMKRDLLAGGYIQADETHVDVQTPDKKGENHRAFFWQYSAQGKGVVFEFEMTRSKKVAKEFFKDYGGILHTDGYVAYEKDIGAKDLIHACRFAHARRGFVDAIKVQTKAQAPDARLERAVALMDDLFAIDRQAREQNLSLADRHALRQECAPVLLDELHTLLSEMTASDTILPQSVAGKAIKYTLKRWVELMQFLKHPVIELSTNWAEIR